MQIIHKEFPLGLKRRGVDAAALLLNQRFQLLKQTVPEAMEFTQPRQCLRLSVSGLKFQQFQRQRMPLLMQRFDDLEGGLRTVARQTLGIEPPAEVAEVAILW